MPNLRGMQMHDVAVTLVGNVVTDPQERMTESGSVVTNFRMAVNPRKYDKFANRWLDGDSMFFNVVCWRTLAGNVTQSINKGDPVIVQGKLRLRRWESGERNGVNVEIDAVHIGHDLTRGVAAFTRTKRGPEEITQEPVDQTNYWESDSASVA